MKYIVIILFILLITVPQYALWRNFAVFKFRLNCARQNMVIYESLPSYDTMMYKFWVWPLDKFIEKE